MTGPGSPALNSPVLSAERRALEIAVKELREFATILEEDTNALDHECCGWGPVLKGLRSTLADIRALVPDAGEPQ